MPTWERGCAMALTGWLRQVFASFSSHRRIRLLPRHLFLEALEERTVPTLLGNQLFPADNPWNQKITNAPVAANSATLVANIGLTSAMHADFGAGTYAGSLIGIPFNVVPGTQAKVNVVIDAYASECDVQLIPIPAYAVIEGDSLADVVKTRERHC